MSVSILSAFHTVPPPALEAGEAGYIDADSLRTTFALAMSAMYSEEVPLYSDLIRIVQNVNKQVLAQTSPSPSSPPPTTPPGAEVGASTASVHDSVERLTLERHGAIRLGTPQELHTVRRIFALMGMHPVGYYDLAVANLPMHATCFRPITAASLEANPFRVFTTLLRPELLTSSEAREIALRLLARRKIFSTALLDLLDAAELSPRQSRRVLTREQGEVFVAEALRSFSWQPVAAASHDEYRVLCAEHPILADIACFRSAHINHLTPRALDIDEAQRSMVAEGIQVKERIEGPPRRRCPVLLRQTSFLALEEGIRFLSSGGGSRGGGDGGEGEGEGDERQLVEGHHKARFGEIEERGAAVTAKGRRLYDELLGEASSSSRQAGGRCSDELFVKVFERFPDSWDELRRQGLIYCEYQCQNGAREKLASLGLDAVASKGKEEEGEGETRSSGLLDVLVQRGVLAARPITYEDFLPFSAAGIFQSNLQSGTKRNAAAAVVTVSENTVAGAGDREGYERAMQCSVLGSEQLYAEAQRRSLERCAAELGLGVDMVAGLV